MSAQQINITLGTAGHIDHGKTALVRLLTGCETDHLKEEIERGMSIELGFAPCLIANMEVGIVDVPGHEHFIKTMVAGATGMDGVLLVVAADDGIMPQTREHLDILTLLGIRHGLVALTKIDRVGPERVEEMRANLETFVRGTFLEGAPILPLSNITGEGFDDFIKGLQALVRSIRPKTVEGVFRLPVEKVFSIKGHGTVVTGIPLAGSAKLGDAVTLLPGGMTGRVTGIQVYGRGAEAVLAGQCAAVNIRHWDAREVHRGNTLTLPGYFEPAEWFVCHMRILPHETFALKNATKIKFHVGTTEAPGSVYLMQGDLARAGEECLVSVKVDAPVIAGPGDRFILRTASPPLTVGGGIVVEAVPRRPKRTPDVIQDLAERAQAVRQDATFVEYALRTAETGAATEAELSLRVKTPLPRVQGILKGMAADGRAVALAPGLHIHRDRAAEAEKRILATLAAFHQESPESPGLEFDALLAGAALVRNVFDPLVARLKAAGRIAERSGRYALAEHRVRFADKDREAMDKVERLFRDRPFTPPGIDDVATGAGLTADHATRVVRLLVEQQRLVQAAPEILFHVEAIEEAKRRLVEFIRQEGCMESVKFKYLLETTRKFAIPLLDYFDKIGVTRPIGHTRYLKAPRRPS